MKLEVGMYVRSKINGMISKITDIEQFEELGQIVERYILDNNYNVGFCSTEKDSVIASNDITDLIEDEDIAVIEYYVSKYRKRITRMFECSLFKSDEAEFVIFENQHCEWWYNKTRKEWVRAKGFNPKIKSIVTKEQFENSQYKVSE